MNGRPRFTDGTDAGRDADTQEVSTPPPRSGSRVHACGPLHQQSRTGSVGARFDSGWIHDGQHVRRQRAWSAGRLAKRAS